jgi:hypothetical protein
VWAAAILVSLDLPLLALLLPAWHSAKLGSAATLWSPAHEKAASSNSYAISSAFVDAVAASPISVVLRRHGMLVNHKRVLRIIREDNLLAVQPRAFVVTTDSDHEFEVYLTLASNSARCLMQVANAPLRQAEWPVLSSMDLLR